MVFDWLLAGVFPLSDVIGWRWFGRSVCLVGEKDVVDGGGQKMP